MNGIKVTLIYRISPGAKRTAYENWARKSMVSLSEARGLIEVRAYRNALKPEQVKIVTSWHSLSDWGRFAESSTWEQIRDELLKSLANDIQVEIWKSSDLFPEAVRSETIRKAKEG